MTQGREGVERGWRGGGEGVWLPTHYKEYTNYYTANMPTIDLYRGSHKVKIELKKSLQNVITLFWHKGNKIIIHMVLINNN